MSRDTRKDFSASTEIEQMLSAETRGDARDDTRVRLRPDERLSMNKLYLQGGVSSSLQDKSAALNHNAHIGESSNNPTAAIIANSNENNDDPPPYAAIPPPYAAIPPPYSPITPSNHIGWPYGLFSFGDSHSTDETTRRIEIPLTPFQACLTSATSFHPEGINGQYASMPLMPYRFFKFGHRNSFVPREMANDGITEKVDDRKSRRYGAILVAAAVIIFLMALSLMVRFIMEKSWLRR